MKIMLAILCLLTEYAMVFGQGNLKVMSFNIRFDNPKDAPNDWPNRIEKVTAQINYHQADIIGVQEALHHQLQQMHARMPAFTYTGAGRDDGKYAGEFSAIYYNHQKLELLQSATFWLSLTPGIAGSKSWDAAITRVVTWACFKERTSENKFVVFNTHFDHIGKEARKQSALLLLHAIDSIAGKMPHIVLGDFNAGPADEPLTILTNPLRPQALYFAKNISASPHYGPHGTFNGFTAKEISDEPIDHILVNEKWKVLDHATISQTWGGLFSSDHFPVLATLVLKPSS